MNDSLSNDIVEVNVPRGFWDEWMMPLWDIEIGKALRLRYFMIGWISLTLALGVPGNILVIASVAFMRHLRQIPHIFVVNLAVFDLGVMGMNCFVLVGCFTGDTFWTSHPLLCEISGVMCMMSCFGSLWTMMFVAINRFVYVCKHEVYDKLFDLKGTLATTVLIWVCVILLDLPNFKVIGLGSHEFSVLLPHCSFGLDNAWWFNTLLYTGMALTFPMLVMIYCYYRIWTTASQSAKTMQSSSSTNERRQKEQRQLMTSLVTIFVAFVITWLPFGLLVFVYGIKLDLVFEVPFELTIVFELFAHSNSAINFIIYGFTHRGFRRAYKMWLCKLMPCCGNIVTLDTEKTHGGTVTNTNKK